MQHNVQRPRLSLDGAWQFRTDPARTLEAGSPGIWGVVDVPAPWQSQSAELRDYQGVAWYRRQFEIPANWRGKSVILHFGAVDYIAEVWVNGTAVGTHEGGYLPFELDITGGVQPGQSNEVTVRVTDPDNNRERWPETPFSEISHGKQSWYGPLSGIWQSVAVEARAALHITNLKVTPDARSGQVEVQASLSTDPAPGTSLAFVIAGPDGLQVANSQTSAAGRTVTATLAVDSVERWELDRPALYTLTATVSGHTGDLLQARFGFRTFESRDGVLWLNDKPLMLRGALDQDYYPEDIATPPSYEFLLHQAQLAKRMGLNCLRCHIKVADPRYLAAADEVGLLVWAELPNWEHWTPAGGQRGVETLKGVIERDWNHPSIVIWTVINESWGVDLQNPEHRGWLRDAFAEIKAADPTRLVVDNSACFNNFHLKSDIDDYHFYAAMPDERTVWSKWVAQFAARAKWSYGTVFPELPKEYTGERWKLGDAGYGAVLPEVERSGTEPLIVSEFGNWGLPSLNDLRGPEGTDPWWFETGDDWGDGVVYPHGVEERFKRLGLRSIFGDYETFSAATRRAEFEALQFEIEEMRRYPVIGGYVITEFTDVHWECNGLLDMRRNPKMPLSALAELNADTILILDRSQGAAWSGEERSIAVAVSHWGAQAISGAQLRWSLDGVESGSNNVAALEPRTTTAVGEIKLTAPSAGTPETHTLRIELWDGADLVAASSMRLAVYPRQNGTLPPVYVYNAPELRQQLSALGYPLRDTPEQAITVAQQYDTTLHQRVLAGERVVLLAESKDAIDAPLGVQVRPRAGTLWQGSWASSFAWLKGEWAGDGVIDDSFMNVMPTHMINGFAQRSFPNDVLSGLCVGWIQKPVALAGVRRPGRGTVVVSTFRIAEVLGRDPVAQMLFGRLLAAAQ